MQIRPLRRDELDAARELLAANRWNHSAADPAQFETLVSRSQVDEFAVKPEK